MQEFSKFLNIFMELLFSFLRIILEKNKTTALYRGIFGPLTFRLTTGAIIRELILHAKRYLKNKYKVKHYLEHEKYKKASIYKGLKSSTSH